MNGYVVGGYVVSIGSLVTYGCSIAGREQRRDAGSDVPLRSAVRPKPHRSKTARRPEPEAEWSGPPTEPT